MSRTRSPRTGAAAESAASVTSVISLSMRVCSVTQRRVASLFQNARCAIATDSVPLMPRCPSVSSTVKDPPKMASADRCHYSRTTGIGGAREVNIYAPVASPGSSDKPRSIGVPDMPGDGHHDYLMDGCRDDRCGGGHYGIGNQAASGATRNTLPANDTTTIREAAEASSLRSAWTATDLILHRMPQFMVQLNVGVLVNRVARIQTARASSSSSRTGPTRLPCRHRN
jgi:hypothetical protein